MADPQLGEKRTFWAIDYDKLEEGPYKVEASFEAQLKFVGSPQYFWKLSEDEFIYCSRNGMPFSDRSLAATECEGYDNAIAVLEARISQMEDDISFLQRARDAEEDEN